MFKVGTSGFSYADWKGYFYPRVMQERDMLAFYAERYPMVEVNSTYYKVPAARNMSSMAAKVPEGFEFVVKAHGSITHERVDHRDGVVSMRRRHPLADALLIMNFQAREASWALTERGGPWMKLLCSAAVQWNGPGDGSPSRLEQGQQVRLSPWSSQLYAVEPPS